MKSDFEEILKEHKQAFDHSFTSEQIGVLEKITREILKTLKAGHKLMICGNGGSAADSQHIAAEFIGRFKLERRALPAIALTTDTSALTALANDYSFDCIFSRQIEGLGLKGDLLIAISTSGNSKNILAAAAKARGMGIAVVAFTGADGGNLKAEADLCFAAHSKKTPHIQEMHITALHAISEVAEKILFGA